MTRFYSKIRTNLSLCLVLFVIFLDHVGLGLVYPLFSSILFQPENSFVDPSTSDISKGLFLGFLLSAPAIATFFSGPLLGALSDQKGRRPLYLFSLTLAVFGYIFCMLGIFLKSIIVLIVSRTIVGISMGNAAVVSATIADLSNENNKTKNFGLYCMASGIGFAMGPFLGGWLGTKGLIVPFFAASIAIFMNLILIFFFFKETNLMKKSVTIRVSEGIRNLKKAFKIQKLRVLIFVVIFLCFGWSLFYEFLPVIWISDYGYSLKKIGLHFAFGSGIFALSSGILIRPISDHFKPYSILFYSLCAMGCFILFPLVHPSPLWIWFYLAMVNFLIALAFPTYTAMVSNSVGKDSQGEILGILESLQATAFGISPLLAGFLLGIHIHMPMILGGISMLFAATLLRIEKKAMRSKFE